MGCLCGKEERRETKEEPDDVIQIEPASVGVHNHSNSKSARDKPLHQFPTVSPTVKHRPSKTETKEYKLLDHEEPDEVKQIEPASVFHNNSNAKPARRKPFHRIQTESSTVQLEPKGSDSSRSNFQGVAQEEPWCLDSVDLEDWFKDHIEDGMKDFDTDCRKAIDTVVRLIHDKLSAKNELFNVDKVIKGGSLGKDTMLQDFSDVDLVAFINPPYLQPIGSYPSPQDYQNKLKVVIRNFKNASRKLRSVTIKRTDQYLVNFEIKVCQRLLNVDLLLTANNGDPQDMCTEMLHLTNDYDRGFYSASLVEYRRDFVRCKPRSVRDLIRLVKYWAYTWLPKNLQKSYPLELITIHRWEKAGEPENFSKAQGLKDVLKVLANRKWKRRTFWVKNYDKQMALRVIKQLKMNCPVILDPANPTNNVCRLYHKGGKKKQIGDVAKETLQTPLLRNVRVRSYWS